LLRLLAPSPHNKPTPSSERLLYPFRSLQIAPCYANNRGDEQFFPLLKRNDNPSTTVWENLIARLDDSICHSFALQWTPTARANVFTSAHSR